jgi:hypothetical protein
MSLGSGCGVASEWWFAWCNDSLYGTEHNVALTRILRVVFSVDNNDLSGIELLVEDLL